MHIVNKKFIVLIISLCLPMFSSLVFADNSDCGTFGSWTYKDGGSEYSFGAVDQVWGVDGYIYTKFLSKEQQLAIIDKESINTAILNLKKYCCEKELGGLDMKLETCENVKTFFNDNIIDSPYLFDHLFDVVMRRLSGLTGEYDIYTKTNMSGDSLGLERRSWINSQAENVSGANPQILIDKYQQFWQPSSPQSGYDISEKLSATFRDLSDQDFLTYVSGQGGSDESVHIAEVLKNYDSWTLYDRYNNACAITQYLYALLDLGVSSEDKVRTINNLARGACKQVVKSQIDNENSYVKLVILQAGNLFLHNYRQGYISYLYERGKTLMNTWRDVSDKFLDVVRGVPHLVHTSVK